MTVLGFDTSNYTSSVALVGAAGEVLEDGRKRLVVKPGGRGLRQSEALFQHWENLPELAGPVLREHRLNIGAVAVSDRPRPADGSYMPVFLAGLRYGEAVATALGVPLLRFSHQEGHARAGVRGTCLEYKERFLAWHISGGTSELLFFEEGAARKVGGSKDISFGQLLDRVGVALEAPFPCGAALDVMATGHEAGMGAEADGVRQMVGAPVLSAIAVDGLSFNLSGIETQALREIERLKSRENTEKRPAREGIPFSAGGLVHEVFCRIGSAITAITVSAAAEYGIDKVLFTGGVAASMFLRGSLPAWVEAESVRANRASGPRKTKNGAPAWGGTGAAPRPECVFGDANLSSDNAVGVALLGMDAAQAIAQGC
ncbi:MAG: hypothetical protein LBG71_05155 [Clostridiales Family XIII bacterium]|jgi:N6-L-threonylcarbamoyladenine synthase|nr:hypothetical protein [Clostridiales Family XIII bacterium]